jgi:hypothetical protein
LSPPPRLTRLLVAILLQEAAVNLTMTLCVLNTATDTLPRDKSGH